MLASSALEAEVALLHQLLDEVVQELGDLGLNLSVSLPLPPELLQHLGGELPALEESLEEGLLQGVQGVVVFHPGESPIGMEMGPTGEPPVQEEVGQVLQEVLQVEGVEPAALVLRSRYGSACADDTFTP